MINPAGLRDIAIHYQRIAALAAAEAMDLRIALARMGRRPTEDEVLMVRQYDRAAQDAGRGGRLALAFLLFQGRDLEQAD